MNTLSIIALTIIAVFCLFILKKKGKTASDYFLLLTNVSLALVVYSGNAAFEENINGLKLFVHFNASFWFISSFFLYAYSLIQGNGKFTFKYWLFAFSIPFFLFSAVDLFLLHPGEINYFQKLLREPSLVYHAFFKLHRIYVFIVGMAIIREINSYEAGLRDHFSSLESFSLAFLKNFTLFVIISYAVQLATFLLYNFGFIPEIESVYLIIGVITVMALFYLSYNGLRQYALPEVIHTPESPPEKDRSVSPKQEERSEENARIFEQLIDFFEESSPYLHAELRIGWVADELAIPKHKLSQAINDQFGKPFYDFVASYRIKYLKNRLVKAENSNYTILSLALDSGFNSKASMNRTFKEHTGMSPSAYKKSHFKNETHT